MFSLVFLFLCNVFGNEEVHPYHFCYAEIEYNADNEIFEASMDFSTHDLEAIYNKDQHASKNITIDLDQEENLLILEQYINKHFYFSSQNAHFKTFFKIEGFDAEVNGNIILFLKAYAPRKVEKLFFTFDLFMDIFPSQENKMTFLQKKSKETYNFNSIRPGCWIQIH